jgi:flagellar biosynthesis regulator FlaF
VTAALKTAREGSAIQQVRALADNQRLWTMVVDLMADHRNALPEPLRASIMSVGMTVRREMEGDDPNFDFLISINENITAGLAGQP